ncbi:alpha/beta hydrolase [Levilactobacillus bambusae]|uniref:Alpha/beta hydrolase n=1 Tax=Levilactobacillus bambusae TaxID=2024736 RepID=A0A2V1MZY9_9LACO|nr:alpha/beta hydrolase [Levilactobacillus bambusae]PWG00534.1 alpha/beta hydrolase [Levilactobacillus bambusae]
MKFIDREVPFVAAQTQFVKQQQLNLSYAEGDRHQLDVYLPNEGAGPFPTIIDIYGGGLYFGEKSSHKMEGALRLLERGFAVVSPNYSLSWQRRYPAQIFEIKAAIRYVRAHAKGLQLDPDNFFLMGESSGAQLAMMVAATDAVSEMQNDLGGNLTVDSRVNAVIASYGPYDFRLMRPQFETLGITPKFPETGAADSFEGMMFGKTKPANAKAAVAKANPANWLTPQMPPVLLYAGTADAVVPYIQSVNLASELVSVLGERKVEWHWLEGAHHGPADFLTPVVYDQKEAFLRRFETATE